MQCLWKPPYGLETGFLSRLWLSTDTLLETRFILAIAPKY